MEILTLDSSGGDSNWHEFLTLPNILKVFNPHLYGYSTGISKLISSDENRVDRSFNFAQTGADSDDVIQQVRLNYHNFLDK